MTESNKAQSRIQVLSNEEAIIVQRQKINLIITGELIETLCAHIGSLSEAGKHDDVREVYIILEQLYHLKQDWQEHLDENKLREIQENYKEIISINL